MVLHVYAPLEVQNAYPQHGSQTHLHVHVHVCMYFKVYTVESRDYAPSLAH